MKTSGEYVTMDSGADAYEVYRHDLSPYGVREVAFNVDWVPADQRDWLLGVMGSILDGVAGEAYRAGRDRTRQAILEALGLR